MAKGKGKVKGWITKNGVHIPIYEKYTVREGHEPENVKGKFKSIKKKQSEHTRKAIEKDLKTRLETYWKHSPNFVKSDLEHHMEKADKMLKHFEDKPFIESSKDYDGEIVWKFAGRDKQTGKRASFEFDSPPREQAAKETLRGNGYTVSTGSIFPKPIYEYLGKHTDMNEEDKRVASAVTSYALKEYKKNRKK